MSTLTQKLGHHLYAFNSITQLKNKFVRTILKITVLLYNYNIKIHM